MATETTDILSLPYIMPSQAQKHVTHNEAIATLDMLVQAVVADEAAAPPEAPEPGDRLIVAADPSGVFAGQANALAVYRDGGWVFLTPQAGWRAYDRTRQRVMVFAGAGWEELPPPRTLTGLETVGINSTADAGNRLAVASAASLFTHEGDDHRLKINKAAETDTASLLYQTGYSGRAEMGLTGSADFAIKVSADGASWIEAMRIDAATGMPSFPQGVGSFREVLMANRTYYVRSDGSDSNDGLTNASDGAFKTIRNAVGVALALDMSIYSVTIDVGAGTFAEGGYLDVTGNGNARITIQGAGYDQTAISGSSYGVQASYGLSLTLKDIDVSGGSVGIRSLNGATVTLAGTVQLSGGSSRLIETAYGGIVTNSGGLTLRIDADSAYIFYANLAGVVRFGGTTTIVTTRNITVTAAVSAADLSIVSFTASAVTWDISAGAVTGQRYKATLNSVIDTSTGGGASYFPGSTDGTTATGGQYA